LAPAVGIAATGFCYPGGILQLDKIDKFCGCRQQQQLDRISASQIFVYGDHITSVLFILFGNIGVVVDKF
jgi:hypothetical protein